jgi:general secretion pathway protein A
MQNSNVLNFFGLREAPFNDNLDPRFLFVTPQFETAFSAVMDGIHNRNCFAVVTGEVGTGKTTFIHCLRRRLMQQGLPTAFLFYTHLNRTRLLDFILTDFGIDCKTGETIDDWKRLENWLVQRHCSGQRPVLLVDEAQGLPFSALEEIRMLLNLETSRGKLLQVVLAGELELEGKLKHAQVRELHRRITAHCKTITLNRDETFDYLRHRLQVGGAKILPLFQSDAIDTIYLHSGGIPRVINVLCEQALIKACAGKVPVITPHLIREVARAFQWEYPKHSPATRGPVGLATVDPAPAPRIAVAELPLMTGPAALNQRSPVSPVPSAEATAIGSEVLKKGSRSQIPGPPTTPVQVSPENMVLGRLGPRSTALIAREGEKGRSVELTDSSSPHLRTEFIQESENQTELSHAPLQPKIPAQETGQYAPPPSAMNIKNRRARGPFWAWWFYGSSPKWWKKVDAVMNLPRWRRRWDSLQRWLKE